MTFVTRRFIVCLNVNGYMDLFREFEATRVFLVILVIAFIVALPIWPYSVGWGYSPCEGLGIIFLIVTLLVLTRRI